jgi:hypothetical protein
MKRLDRDTLACVNAACQLFRRAGASTLVLRKVYGPDRSRLWRCRSCGEAFSERRGTALCNMKLAVRMLHSRGIQEPFSGFVVGVC